MSCAFVQVHVKGLGKLHGEFFFQFFEILKAHFQVESKKKKKLSPKHSLGRRDRGGLDNFRGINVLVL